MLSNYIPKRFAQAMIKHVVAVSLFFPYIYSHRNNCYYQDFILANFFAVLAMVFIFTSWKLDLRKNGILLAGMGILLICYNGWATYMNYTYHHWYGEQINTTIIFLFFMVLLMVKDIHALIDNSVIRSIIHMMVTSNVLAIGYRLITGQNRILIMNGVIRRDKYEEIMVDQYSWLYVHKSQYAFILVISIAFCVVYRKMFRNLFTYILTLATLCFALYLSDTYASMGAAVLIFGGQFLDYLWKAKWWKKLVAAVGLGVPGVLVAFKLYEKIGKNRNLLTLNDRTLIWKGSWETITTNANGMIDFNMGVDRFIYYTRPDGWNANSYNCHNVFMNQMFRFSIPVGTIFSLIFVTLLIFAIKRNLSFTTLSIVVATLIPLCMDYALTNVEFILYMSLVFILYFRNRSLVQ